MGTTSTDLVGPAHAIRGYILTLREARDVIQEDLAEAVGLERRAYIDWAMGRTKDLKAAGMCAAFRLLRGSFDHLRDLARPDATYAVGVAMAEMRLREEAADELGSLAATITSEEFDTYLEDAEREAINQAQVIGQIRKRLQRRAR